MWSVLPSVAAASSEEAELVRRMRRGEEAAFGEYFAKNFQPLYRFALSRLGGDAELAKDVTQAAICTGIEKLGTYRGEAPLLTWLCTICRFEISQRYRRLQRRPVEVALPENWDQTQVALAAHVAAPGDPESQLLRAEVARRVHATCDHLPDRYQAALQWKYVEGLSVLEIGERLQLSIKAAESLLTRARVAFRETYNEMLRPTQGRTEGLP
jgi:RNA polymerase sigma-70 factor (ECF subfamily)